MPTQPARPATSIVFGLGAAVCGLYFTLVGLNLLLPPGAQHAPGWIVVAAGLAFLLGGIGVMVQGFGRADAHGMLPPDAPRWITALQHLVALAIGVLMWPRHALHFYSIIPHRNRAEPDGRELCSAAA